MKERLKKYLFRLVHPAVAVPLLIALFGCLTIFNASCHADVPYRLVQVQLAWVVLGTVLLVACLRLDINFLLRWAVVIGGVGVALLYVGTFVRSLWANGQSGSLAMIPGSYWYAEVGELVKPLYIFWLARLAPGQERDVIDWPAFFRYLALAMIWWVPLAFQPNAGLLIVYVVSFVLMLWLQNGRWEQVSATVMIAALALTLLYVVDPTLRRVFYGQFNETNSWVAQAAFRNGGLAGCDPGKTFWAQSYLPLHHPSAPLSALAEGLGMYGVLPMLLGVVVSIYLGLTRAARRRTIGEGLVFSGLTTMLAVQILMHVSMVLGIFHAVEVYLPVFSFGGSSLVAGMVSLGMLINFSLKFKHSGSSGVQALAAD